MNRLTLGLFALASTVFVACNGSDDDTGTDDTGTTCTNAIVSTFPANGATDAFYRTTVEVKLDEAETTATITVKDSASADVAGSGVWNGDIYVFTPTSPLTPGGTYTTNVTYSCAADVVASTFTVSAVGTPVSSALAGRSYLLDLSSGRFVKPEGVGDIIGDFLDQIVLIGVESSGSDKIQMQGALGYEGTSGGGSTDDVDHIFQEACTPSIPFPEADFDEDPYFKAGPADTTLTVAGYTVEIEQLLISGAFGPDGSYVAGATLGGKIDTRPLVPLISDPPCVTDNPSDPNACDPNAICAIASTLFIECESCSGGAATTCEATGANDACCLDLFVDSIVAEEVTGDADAAYPLQTLTDPGTAAETDYCVVNADECGATSECTAR